MIVIGAYKSKSKFQLVCNNFLSEKSYNCAQLGKIWCNMYNYFHGDTIVDHLHMWSSVHQCLKTFQNSNYLESTRLLGTISLMSI